MKLIFDSKLRIKGWFSHLLTLPGWFDQELSGEDEVADAFLAKRMRRRVAVPTQYSMVVTETRTTIIAPSVELVANYVVAVEELSVAVEQNVTLLQADRSIALAPTDAVATTEAVVVTAHYAMDAEVEVAEVRGLEMKCGHRTRTMIEDDEWVLSKLLAA